MNEENLWNMQEHPVCCHNDSELHDSLFPTSVCARFSFKSSYSLQFHLSESSHKLLLLSLCCLPFISTSLPSNMSPLQVGLWSSPCVSPCHFLLQLSIFPLLHLSGHWYQVLKSALNFSPQAHQYPPARLLWIIFSNSVLEHHIVLFA